MKNIAVSVRNRLMNISRQQKRPFMEMAQRYALERFLYRLSQSEHGTKFILKGAMLLKVWNFPNARPTMDVDLLGLTSNDSEKIAIQIKGILQTEVEDDGLQFDVESVSTQDITQQSEYVGLRIIFKAKLDTMILNMQVDMGFGDAVYPNPINREIPPILDFPAPKMLCYQPETSIAEKFHAMVQHDRLNSRMKDFYDIWYLSHHMEFEAQILVTSIQSTFQKREVKVPGVLVAFSSEFIAEKQPQWAAFKRKMGIEVIPTDFGEVVERVKRFIEPLLPSCRGGKLAITHWNKDGWI